MSPDEGLVCCTAGDREFALRAADVRQIVPAENMRTVGGDDTIAGTLDLDGQAVPVFRLENVLGRTASRRHPRGPDNCHIAVTGDRSEIVGWLVDRVVHTPLSDDTKMSPLPAIIGPAARSWFEAVVKLDGTSILLIAPQYLNPLAQQPVNPDVRATFAPVGQGKTADATEPIVLLFSTQALPRCAATRFALSGRQVAAIAQPMSTIPVPGSATYVTGVAWWRDLVVPVIDFRGWSEHDDGTERRRQLIAHCGPRLGNALVAFEVDAEITLHRPGAGNQMTAGVQCPPFAAGMFDIGGEPVALLDLDLLLWAGAPQS